MRHATLRALLLVAVASFVSTTDTASARGPGGGGGRAGARAGGGPGAHGPDVSTRDRKKKDGSQLQAGGLNGVKLNGGGPVNAATKFPGMSGGLKDGKFKDLDFQPKRFQSQQFDAQQQWPSRDAQVQQHAQNAVSGFKNGPQPFTAQWYADHPNAWQATHPHVDAWAAASAAGIAAWLGWGNQPAYYETPGTVVYQENFYQETPADESATNEEAVANSTDTSESDSQWLSIGVYSVLTITGEPTSRYLQLATNQQGELGGAYYDSISGTSQNLSGRIDRTTQTAEWSLDSNPDITFRASLNELTQPTGTIAVSLPTGKQEWRVARQESAN